MRSRTWSDEPDLVQVKLHPVGIKALEVDTVPPNARFQGWAQIHKKVYPSLGQILLYLRYGLARCVERVAGRWVPKEGSPFRRRAGVRKHSDLDTCSHTGGTLPRKTKQWARDKLIARSSLSVSSKVVNQQDATRWWKLSFPLPLEA